MKSNVSSHLPKCLLLALSLGCFQGVHAASERDATPIEAKPAALGAVEALDLDGFLICYADGEFAAGQSGEGAISGKFEVNDIHWFEGAGREGRTKQKSGTVMLETPITASQHDLLKKEWEKHGAGGLYLVFIAQPANGKDGEFRGTLVGCRPEKPGVTTLALDGPGGFLPGVERSGRLPAGFDRFDPERPETAVSPAGKAGEPDPDKDFVTGFLGKAVADETTGMIRQIHLHYLQPYQGGMPGSETYMGIIDLEEPITPERFKALKEVCDQKGKEQVFVKVAALPVDGNQVNFRGKLLGYYVVSTEDRWAFETRMNWGRFARGFVKL